MFRFSAETDLPFVVNVGHIGEQRLALQQICGVRVGSQGGRLESHCDIKKPRD